MRSLGRDVPRRSARGCLREYAEQIGLDPAFTIHDREDSADLMNLVRHELGFSKTESRFPTKGTCLAIYSRGVNAEVPLDEVLRDVFPVVRRLGEPSCSELFAAYVEAKQTAERARLRRSAALLGADDERSGARRPISAAASIMSWSTSIRTPIACRPRSCWR